jgi:hypothetical protein
LKETLNKPVIIIIERSVGHGIQVLRRSRLETGLSSGVKDNTVRPISKITKAGAAAQSACLGHVSPGCNPQYCKINHQSISQSAGLKPKSLTVIILRNLK